MNNLKKILKKIPENIVEELEVLPQSTISQLEEIRLICGQPIRISYGRAEKFLAKNISKDDLQKILNNLIKFSYYAYEDDLAKGFVTIEGGHRVGICGKTVIKN